MICTISLYQEKCSTLLIRLFSSILSSSNFFSKSLPNSYKNTEQETWQGLSYSLLWNCYIKNALWHSMRRKISLYSLWTGSLLSPPFNLFLIFISPFPVFHLFCHLCLHFYKRSDIFSSLHKSLWHILYFHPKFPKSHTISKIHLGFLNVSVKLALLFAKVEMPLEVTE